MPDNKNGTPVKLDENEVPNQFGQGACPATPDQRNDVARNELKMNEMMAPLATSQGVGADRCVCTMQVRFHGVGEGGLR